FKLTHHECRHECLLCNTLVKLLTQFTNMPSPPTSVTTATYTTIPIAGGDVINRSVQNLNAFLSRCRPWPEFLAGASSVDIPTSFSDAAIRVRRNFKYFSVNYAILISACAACSLIGTPILLIFACLIFASWLIFLFFREDPMVVLGHQVSDLAVISVSHGGLRNPEGLFVDEDDAVSTGLISNAERGSC
ncbi:hypothetical protein AABB24_033674, partial [Solanum stoloniferum]